MNNQLALVTYYQYHFIIQWPKIYFVMKSNIKSISRNVLNIFHKFSEKMEIIKKNHSKFELWIHDFLSMLFYQIFGPSANSFGQASPSLFCKSLYHDFSMDFQTWRQKLRCKMLIRMCNFAFIITIYLLWPLKHTANTGSLNIVCW